MFSNGSDGWFLSYKHSTIFIPLFIEIINKMTKINSLFTPNITFSMFITKWTKTLSFSSSVYITKWTKTFFFLERRLISVGGIFHIWIIVHWMWFWNNLLPVADPFGGQEGPRPPRFLAILYPKYYKLGFLIEINTTVATREIWMKITEVKFQRL